MRNYRQIGAAKSSFYPFSSQKSAALDVNTKLLMHFDMLDNGKFIDEINHTITNNNVTLSNISKFGVGSASFNAATFSDISYLSTGIYQSDLNFSNKPTSIDLWVQLKSIPTSSGNGFCILSSSSSGLGYDTAWNISIDWDRRLLVSSYNSNTISVFYICTNILTWEVGRWYHIAFEISGPNSGNPFIKIFRDGIEQAHDTANSSYKAYTGQAFANTTLSTLIGRFNGFNGAGAANFNGYMDELRILIGSMAWTGNFTPPINPY